MRQMNKDLKELDHLSTMLLKLEMPISPVSCNTHPLD